MAEMLSTFFGGWTIATVAINHGYMVYDTLFGPVADAAPAEGGGAHRRGPFRWR